MYLAPYLILIAVVAVVASIFSGGIATIVLVPIAVIAAVAAAVSGGAARGARLREAMVDNRPTPNPAPQDAEPEHGAGQQPVTPEQYVNVRQKAQ